jgi:hypothetical protein
MAGTRRQGDAAGPRQASARTWNKAADFEWLHEVRAQVRKAKEPEAPLGPEVVFCDGGELDDLAELLRSLGVPPLRVRPADLKTLQPWELPSLLFATTVRIGLVAPLPSGLAHARVTRLAIGDGDSATATTAMLRRGFRYVVRRPVHPEAMRLLFAQILFRGRDQRRATRFPYGGEVRWRIGLRSGRCLMTEISSAGCRLLLQEPVRLGQRIALRVPVERGSSRSVKLRGRVLRRDLGRPELGAARSLALGFEPLPARALAHLDLLLAACAAGPTTANEGLAGGPWRPADVAPTPGLGPPRLRSLLRKELRADPLADPKPEAQAPEFERRLAPRALLAREVVALDPAEGRVTHALFGRDLSVGGMSVEPHPLLSPGERLQLALYAPDRDEPIVVSARVVRADGSRGFGLRFDAPPPDVAARLEKLVGALPGVESLAEDESRAQGVVLGEIVLARKPQRRR